jgi:hypothetical protein
MVLIKEKLSLLPVVEIKITAECEINMQEIRKQLFVGNFLWF